MAGELPAFSAWTSSALGNGHARRNPCRRDDPAWAERAAIRVSHGFLAAGHRGQSLSQTRLPPGQHLCTYGKSSVVERRHSGNPSPRRARGERPGPVLDSSAPLALFTLSCAKGSAVEEAALDSA